MKVLYITHYTELLGANRSLMQLILELRVKGIEPIVLIPKAINSKPSYIRDFLIENSIRYIEAPLRMVKHPVAWKSGLNYFYSILLRKKILSTIKNEKFDIIHTNSSVIDIGAYISKKMHVINIWHLREFGDLDYNLKTPFGKWYQKIIYNGNNHFIAVSKKIIKHYTPYLKSQPIDLIYNGIKPLPFRHKEPGNLTQFCIVGLLHKNKRQFDVIRAVNELVNHRIIKNLHLTIIGSGEHDYMNSMMDFISKNKLSEYIEFVGQRNDVHELLQQMDVGIMASSNEAFGRVTVEYMMNGLTVIASDGGANCEIIEDGITGLIYETGNHIALANKMQYLINDVEYTKTIASNGYKKALEQFSSTTNSNHIYQLYNSIMKKPVAYE